MLFVAVLKRLSLNMVALCLNSFFCRVRYARGSPYQKFYPIGCKTRVGGGGGGEEEGRRVALCKGKES